LDKLLTRREVKTEHTWNLESIYQTKQAWEQDLTQVNQLMPALTAYHGRLGESPAVLLEALKVRDELFLALSTLVVFASMRKDEDTAAGENQGMFDRGVNLSARARAAGSFLTPEILALPEGTLERFLQASPGLQAYRFELEDLMRERAHVRSPEVEELLAQGSEVAGAAGRIFNVLSGADLKFPLVKDEDGNEVELTEGRWGRFRESPVRAVRENAFRALYGTYAKFRNTLAATHSASVKKDVFIARARRYANARAAGLSGDNIPETVYDNLVATVNKNLPILHRYLHLRRRLLQLDQLHMWDLYNPMVAEVEQKVPYEQAVETIMAALAPLGPEYIKIAREGLTTARWVDIYENQGKRSGAYSHGSYRTQPFILMNYSGNLDSMFTLAHELGHSMHSYLSRQHQPFHYAQYTIFVAEVASTFAESLLSDYLLRQTNDRVMRMSLINHSLEQFRATLFRQTMFAEFEHQTHQRAEANEALTADWLCSNYFDLNQRYYGTEGVLVDHELEMEWSRIPHFYSAFYVYKYATGISAAAALSQQVLHDGQPAVDRFLGFLKKGGSDYSINLLRDAGVDMASPAPVQQALDLFSRRLDEMEQLVAQG